jgi:hypothetical protein
MKDITPSEHSQDSPQKVILRKCSCGSVWCPTCFKRSTAPKIAHRLQRMDSARVRQVVLTVNPLMFEDGEAAYHHLSRSKAIAQLIHNLQRTAGKGILDWYWLIEWHRNGFPHWHVFIEVDTAGKAGMIGGDSIRKYWHWGAVREAPINGQQHWQAITGYFGKHGYFNKNKAHQARLPEWAKAYKTSIKRRSGKRIPDETPKDPGKEQLKKYRAEKKEREKKEMPENAEKKDNVDRSYEVILSECGAVTMVVVNNDFNGFGCGFPLRIPYKKLVQVYRNKGEYVNGIGFVIPMTAGEASAFLAESQLLEQETRKNAERAA